MFERPFGSLLRDTVFIYILFIKWTESLWIQIWLHIHSVRQFQFHPSVIHLCALPRSRLLGLPWVEIPIYLNFPFVFHLLFRHWVVALTRSVCRFHIRFIPSSGIYALINLSISKCFAASWVWVTDHCFLPAGGPGDEHPFSRFRGEQHLFALLILIKNMLYLNPKRFSSLYKH